MATNNGGPAFPNPGVLETSPHASMNGMTLRDYFAAKAMHGMLAASAFNSVSSGELEDPPLYYMQRIAAVSFEMADAMLAAREVKP